MTKAQENNQAGQEDEVLSTVFTLPNLISFLRLCLVPCFLVMLLHGFDAFATILFAVAASTDWIDGQVARRTHTVSKFGQLFDPFVDRILMVCGVVGLMIVGRLPVWIVVLVVARDLYLLIGGAWLLKNWKIRVPVVYAGKFATTFLFIGFAALLLNFPIIEGLGLVSLSWLPGFSSDPYCWGIWFVYAGLILSLGVTIYYSIAAWRKLQEAKRGAAAGQQAQAPENADGNGAAQEAPAAQATTQNEATSTQN